MSSLAESRLDKNAPPEVKLRTARLCVGTWRNVFIVLWRAKPEPADVDLLRTEYIAMAAASVLPFVVWVIIEAQAAAPDEPVRRGITNVMKMVGDKIAASLAVMEATGFVAAATRGALIAMTALSRTEHPTKFFATVDEAAPWSCTWTRDNGQPPMPHVVSGKISAFRQMVKA